MQENIGHKNNPFHFDLPVEGSFQPTQKYVVSKWSFFQRAKKVLLHIILFPLGFAKLIHILAGNKLIIASSIDQKKCAELRKKIISDHEWKYIPITLQIEGYSIDAMAVINKNAEKSKKERWMLQSNGNDKLYEEYLQERSVLHELLTKTESHGLVFNGPGLGMSSGLITRSGLQKAYQAALHFLEDQENGAKAKEIIGYGYSLGGAIEAEATKNHLFKKEIKYTFIKDRTFSTLKKGVSGFFLDTIKGKIQGLIISLVGWNIKTITGSLSLIKPEIIIQAGQEDSTEKKETEKEKLVRIRNNILHDSSISKNAALATALIDNSHNINFLNKKIITTYQSHLEELNKIDQIATQVNIFMKQQKSTSAA